jgi:hypothetical protein
MIWERTENKNSLRSGEFVIIKWLMPDQKYIYCLWHQEKLRNMQQEVNNLIQTTKQFWSDELKTNFQHFNGLQEKWCSNCSRFRTIDGGQDIVFNKGRNKRWICAHCKIEREARKAA